MIGPAIQQIGGQVIDHALTHPEQTATVIAGIVGVGVNYQKTGSIPLGRLPWRYIRQMARDLGDKYFGVSRPKGVPGVVIDAKPADVEAALRDVHFESSDLYSYEYAGEVWGLRRPSGTKRHPKTGELTPMETHPRGFETGDGRTLVICHDEASRWEATGDHLDESMMSWTRGRDILTGVLDDAGLEYRIVESEAHAQVDVKAD